MVQPSDKRLVTEAKLPAAVRQVSGLTIGQVTNLQGTLDGKVTGLGGVKAVKYAPVLPAWTPADEGTLIFVPSA